MLATLLNKTAVIYRLQQRSPLGDDKYKESWATTGTTIKCAIQPAGPTDMAMTDGQYGKTFKLFCARSVMLKIGDRILYSGKYYYVRGVEDFDYGRAVKHKEAVLEVPLIEAIIVNTFITEDSKTLLTEAGDSLALN